MDKLPQSEIKYENRITKWFKNYWYYYKWKVIIAVFLIFVAVFCIAQACSNTDNDMVIMYAGSFASTSLEVPNIESALSAVLPEDYDGDGRKTVAMSMMTIYTEDQIKQLEANGFVVNRSNNQGELDKFQNLIVTGEYNVCLLEPWLYDMVQKEGGFAKLSEVLGYTPESAVDDYAIKLSDTDFGKYFAAPALLLYFAWIILNLILIYSCYARICDENDVDMEVKPSRFAFVNRMRQKSEERRLRLEAEREEYKSMREQRRKK